MSKKQKQRHEPRLSDSEKRKRRSDTFLQEKTKDDHERVCQQMHSTLFQKLNSRMREVFAHPGNQNPEAQRKLAAHYWREASAINRKYAPEGGVVYVCGSDDLGLMGYTYLQGDMTNHKRWKQMVGSLSNTIVSIAVGDGHALALGKDGTAFSWGGSEHGGIGRRRSTFPFDYGSVTVYRNQPEDDTKSDIYEKRPDQVVGLLPSKHSIESVPVANEDSSIIQIAAGDTHSLFLTRHSNVYMSGCYKQDKWMIRPHPPPDIPLDEDQEVGNVKNNPPPPKGVNQIPRQVLVGHKIKDIASGQCMSALVTEDGRLLTMGFDLHGNLGRGFAYDERDLFTNTQINEKGEEEVVDSLNIPVIEEMLKPKEVIWDGADVDSLYVVNVSIGFGHMLAVTLPKLGGRLEYSVWACGNNSVGQLGLGDTNNRNKMTKIMSLDKEQIAQVSCGAWHSLALNLTGDRLFSFGKREAAALGDVDRRPAQKDYICTEPSRVYLDPDGKEVYPIMSVSSGGNFSVALTPDIHSDDDEQSPTYYGWGLSEDGQLGVGLATTVWRPYKFDRLLIGKKSIKKVIQVAHAEQVGFMIAS